MLKRIVFLSLYLVLAMGIFSSGANAALNAVGPVDAANGFPIWYQDTTGLTLDFCLPKNAAQLNAGACLILPPFTLPLVFPTNFPPEGFYYNATAKFDLSATDNVTVLHAVEGAFFPGPGPVPGEQITFGRLRITLDAPVAGDYTVTTPYGAFFFPGVAVGKRAIVSTAQVGGAPGDFATTLGTQVSPYLHAAASEGGAQLPLFPIPGDTSGDLFLANPATTTFVTGSPTGNNFVEVCTSSGVFPINGLPCIKVNQFSLTGRVFNGVPITAKKAYYVRDALGAGTVYVFGKTSLISDTAAYTAGGTNLTNTAMFKQAATGDIFAAIPFTAGTTLPASVTITGTDVGKTPTTISVNLQDLVTITLAQYNATTHSLILNAASSDLLAVTPTLTATGLGALVNGVLTVPGILAPPASITVSSSKGGIDTKITTFGTLAGTKVANDFNGDGKADILWHNATTGDVYLWLMDGTSIIGGGPLVNVPSPWTIAGTGDFNNDGKTDVLWRNATTGEVYMWLMNGTAIIGGGPVLTVPTAWTIVGTGDFNNDGNADVLWRNTTTGEDYMWLMNGVSIIGGGPLVTVPTAWTIVAP